MKHHLGHWAVNITESKLLHVSRISTSMPTSKWHSPKRAHRHTYLGNNSTGRYKDETGAVTGGYTYAPNYATTQFANPLSPRHPRWWHHARTALIFTFTFHHSCPTSSLFLHLSISLPPSILPYPHCPVWPERQATPPGSLCDLAWD